MKERIPGLAVLMPNYNHARFLPAALEAILAQSRQPDEIIVIDDASTDDSLAVLEGYVARHPALRIVRNERNLGVTLNLNRLITLCRHTHGAFLAADDIVLPGLFEDSMALLEAHPQAGLCSGLIRELTPDGRDNGVVVTPMIADEPSYIPPDRAARFLVEEGQWIVNNTTIYRMQALADAGGFLPELAAFSDGFISDVVALRHGACYIPRELAYWRYNPDGFASRTCADLEGITAIMRTVLRLMSTTHADIFSPQYRDLFRRHLCKRYNPAIRIEASEDRPR